MSARLLVLSVLFILSLGAPALEVGTARIDITPGEDIRLSGYGSRTKPSEGVAQRLHAKALAIGQDDPSIIITADIIGVSQAITDEVRKRLAKSHQVSPARVAICATHTHTGPTIKGLLEDIFMADIPADQRDAITRYTREFTDKLYEVAVAALRNRQAGKLHWGVGKVDFAINRRVLENGKWKGFGETLDGPVDHTLPLLRVTDAKGRILALLANYACHCTTLGGKFNQIHGDWAGRAAELIEAAHPGANALIAIGCGADANPKARGEFASIEPHARQLAGEVDRLLQTKLKPLGAVSSARFHAIALPFDPLPTEADWQQDADANNRFSYYARKMLARLKRGEQLRKELPYQIQSWEFGGDLAMLFLPGEVVVDYSRRLKEVFRADRLWINAYANDAPCYIPSRRLYDEGGYEVDRNMWYYGHPTRLSKDTEELVIDEVIRQLPHKFYSPATLQQMPAPVEKSAALNTIRTRPDLRVELIAAEPLVKDPVNIAWGPDGRLWVVEMADYPLGLDDRGRRGGRVRFLEDSDGDGSYDRSTLFADDLNFPSSVMPWRDGLLITAAPDILFAQDTDNDGRADKFEKLFSGFGEGNQQHRVNGLQWGLDNRIHSANGDSDGEILSRKTGTRLNIRGRDFCFDPDTGQVATESGRTQHGRCRDDAGNWFGVNNSWPAWHVALDDRYLRRNPHVSWPDVRVHLQDTPSAGPVFPASRTLNRLNDFSRVNRFTSACGSTVYRDDLLGAGFRGNYFVCEPVHNLVRREVPKPHGSTFRSRQPNDETGTEFFASTDNWSRPVSARTGPDGALYIVDMYRFLIEHPQWVPADWQRKLKFRDGADKGRIYRLIPKNAKARPIPNFTGMTTRELVDTLASSNGIVRDLAHQQILWRADLNAVPPLRNILRNSGNRFARLHALCILNRLENLDASTIAVALRDADPAVQRHAIRLGETLQDSTPAIAEAFARIAADPQAAPQVRKQLAYSLGFSQRDTTAKLLLQLATRQDADEYLVSAVLSSAGNLITPLCAELKNFSVIPNALLAGLTRTAAGQKNQAALHLLTTHAITSQTSLATFLDSLAAAGKSASSLPPVSRALLRPAFTTAQTGTPSLLNLRILGRAPADQRPGLDRLRPLLTAAASPGIQSAAIDAAVQLHGNRLLTDCFTHWNQLGSSARKSLIRQILRRSDWTLRLLDWLERHRNALTSLNPADRVALTTHRRNDIRERASQLLGATIQSDRQPVIARYAATTATGSVAKGQLLFNSACAVCHVSRNDQPSIGPDLAALSDYSSAALLIAILDPNRAVEDKFLAHTAQTADDREITGILQAESSSEIRLADATGQTHALPRTQLTSLKSSGLSLMPEGFESAISPSAMANLLAFIRSLATPRVVTANTDGTLTLNPGLATITSIHATVTSDAIIGIAGGDTVSWTLAAIPAGHYEIVAESALAADYTGKPFHLTIGSLVADGTFENTRSLTRFRSRKFGNIQIPADLKNVEARLVHDLDGPNLSLRMLALIPVR